MKEFIATLKILLGLLILSLIVYIMSIENAFQYFAYSLFLYIALVLTLYIIFSITNNRIFGHLLHIARAPLEIFIICGKIFCYYTTIVLTIYIYFALSVVLTKMIIYIILIYHFERPLTNDTIDYLKITTTVYIAVLLNSYLKKIIRFIFPLKKIYKNYSFDKLNSSIDYLINKKNIKYIIYFFYLIIVVISSLDKFQSIKIFSDLTDSEVILKSFATFIALDKCIDLLDKVDFKPSKFFEKLKLLYNASKNID